MNGFSENIHTWLTPLGFQPIFSNNDYTEIHYIKDGVRVMCFNKDLMYYQFSGCYVGLTRMPLTLTSGKFLLPTEDVNFMADYIIFKAGLDKLKA